MQTTHQAVELIKHFESFRPDPYYDVGGVITIGYGTARTYKDGHPIQIGDEIDEPSAEEELAFHLRNKVEPAIDRIFEGVPLTFNKADALASFLHNLGHGNPKKYETLVRLIKDGAPEDEICDQWCKYRMAGGRRQLGLYRRRLAEIALYKGRPWEGAKEATWATKWQHVTGDEVPAAPEDDPDLVIPRRGAQPAPPPPGPPPHPSSPETVCRWRHRGDHAPASWRCEETALPARPDEDRTASHSKACRWQAPRPWLAQGADCHHHEAGPL